MNPLGIFISCCVYPFIFLSTDKNKNFILFARVFIFSLFFGALFCFMAVKIPISKNFLYKALGQQYIESYLGKNTGSGP